MYPSNKIIRILPDFVTIFFLTLYWYILHVYIWLNGNNLKQEINFLEPRELLKRIQENHFLIFYLINLSNLSQEIKNKQLIEKNPGIFQMLSKVNNKFVLLR